MSEVGVTVIVPTLNRAGFLPACLADLLAQNHRPLEILVVDQSDDRADGIGELPGRHRDVVSYYRVGFQGLPEARNFGWQYARHDAIVFVDDDIRCGPELVAEHLRALRLPGVGLVAGAIEEAHGEGSGRSGLAGRFHRWTATPERGFASHAEYDVDHAPGGNFSTWRTVVTQVGGFDEALNVGAALYEELELCLRVKERGHRIYFNGRARVTHLAAGDGGCRVANVGSYVRALAHNRALLIRRHLRWFQTPVAVARLGLLGASYSLHYRKPRALLDCAAGCFDGLRAGGRFPKCTVYDQKVSG